MLYSPSSGGFYRKDVHGVNIPGDAVPMSLERYLSTIASPPPGKVLSHDSNGIPIRTDPPPYVPTVAELCQRIDTAADTARARVAGDPLRAVEYDRARIAAEQFAAANYQGDVPPMVAAWAINGRTAQEAADDILHEAAQYTAALIALRETRLQAKERVRKAMDAGDIELAQSITDETVAAIQAAVAGVGNAGA